MEFKNLRIFGVKLPKPPCTKFCSLAVCINQDVVAIKILPTILHILNMKSEYVEGVLKFPSEIVDLVVLTASKYHILLACANGHIFSLRLFCDGNTEQKPKRKRDEEENHNTFSYTSEKDSHDGDERKFVVVCDLTQTEDSDPPAIETDLFMDISIDRPEADLVIKQQTLPKVYNFCTELEFVTHRGVRLIHALSETCFLACGILEPAAIYFLEEQSKTSKPKLVIDKIDGSIPTCILTILSSSISQKFHKFLFPDNQSFISLSGLVTFISDSAGYIRIMYSSTQAATKNVHVLAKTERKIVKLCKIGLSNNELVHDIVAIGLDGTIYSLLLKTFVCGGLQLPSPVSEVFVVGKFLIHLTCGKVYVSNLFDNAIGQFQSSSATYQEQNNHEIERAPIDKNPDVYSCVQSVRLITAHKSEARMHEATDVPSPLPTWRPFLRPHLCNIGPSIAALAVVNLEAPRPAADKLSHVEFLALSWSGKVLLFTISLDDLLWNGSLEPKKNSSSSPFSVKNQLEHLSELWKEHQKVEGRTEQLLAELKGLRGALSAAGSLKASFKPAPCELPISVTDPSQSQGEPEHIPFHFTVEVQPRHYSAAGYIVDMSSTLKKSKSTESSTDLSAWVLMHSATIVDPLHKDGKRVETWATGMPAGFGHTRSFQTQKRLELPTISSVKITAWLLYPFKSLPSVMNHQHKPSCKLKCLALSESKAHNTCNMEAPYCTCYEYQGEGNRFESNQQPASNWFRVLSPTPGPCGAHFLLGTWVMDFLDWSLPAPCVPMNSAEMRRLSHDIFQSSTPEEAVKNVLKSHLSPKSTGVGIHSKPSGERGSFSCVMVVHFSQLCQQQFQDEGQAEAKNELSDAIKPLELLLGQTSKKKYKWLDTSNAVAGVVFGDAFSIVAHSLKKPKQQVEGCTLGLNECPGHDCGVSIQVFASTKDALLRVRSGLQTRMQSSISDVKKKTSLLGNMTDLEDAHCQLQTLAHQLDALFFDLQQLTEEFERFQALHIPNSLSLVQRVEILEQAAKENAFALVSAIERIPINL